MQSENDSKWKNFISNNVIRKVKLSDAQQLADIYNHYVLNTTATFEEKPIGQQEMLQRIQDISQNYLWLVLEVEERIKGYAYATKWKSRSAYKYSVESTVYLRTDETGNGYGSRLMEELISSLSKMNMHAIMGGIALPNSASIALHEKFGFEKVAHFKDVGYKFEKWIDVGYWQLILDKAKVI